MAVKDQDETYTNLLRGAVAGIVRRDQADLSARQLAIFLICYLDEPGQSVRGLAAGLNLSRPAVTRSLDRLTQFDLIRRKPDPAERRNVLVHRTTAGNAFLRELRAIMNAAGKPQPLPQRSAPRRRLASGAAA